MWERPFCHVQARTPSLHGLHLSIGSLQPRTPVSHPCNLNGTLAYVFRLSPFDTLLTHRPASCNRNCQNTNIEEIAPSTQRHNQLFGTALCDTCGRKLLKGKGCFIGCLGVKLASVSVSASTAFWSHFLQRDADAVHRFERIYLLVGSPVSGVVAEVLLFSAPTSPSLMLPLQEFQPFSVFISANISSAALVDCPNIFLR